MEGFHLSSPGVSGRVEALEASTASEAQKLQKLSGDVLGNDGLSSYVVSLGQDLAALRTSTEEAIDGIMTVSGVMKFRGLGATLKDALVPLVGGKVYKGDIFLATSTGEEFLALQEEEVHQSGTQSPEHLASDETLFERIRSHLSRQADF